MYYLTCIGCGTDFTWENSKKKFCDKCAHTRKLEKAREQQERIRKAKIAAYSGDIGWCPIFDHSLSSGMKKIIECVKRADKVGKSYEQYMADRYSKIGM